jgi:poly(ADP-ribose) glycohydrolase
VNWTTSEIRLSKSKLRAQRDGAIEAEVAALQADFANASIGGGVMSNGRLQEEIRFCISPEFLVSLLLCETMKETESILIDGALQFSTYRGYADSLEFDSRRLDLDKQRPGDRLLAIDAKFFTSFKAQFKEAFVLRELNKLHSGLSSAFDPSDPVKNTFASGNWGCGAFGGIPQVKALLQLAACAQSHMSLVYICHTDARIDPDKFMQLSVLNTLKHADFFC